MCSNTHPPVRPSANLWLQVSSRFPSGNVKTLETLEPFCHLPLLALDQFGRCFTAQTDKAWHDVAWQPAHPALPCLFRSGWNKNPLHFKVSKRKKNVQHVKTPKSKFTIITGVWIKNTLAPANVEFVEMQSMRFGSLHWIVCYFAMPCEAMPWTKFTDFTARLIFSFIRSMQCSSWKWWIRAIPTAAALINCDARNVHAVIEWRISIFFAV